MAIFALAVVFFAVSLVSQSSAVVFPRQTSISNSTATSSGSPSVITASASDGACCFVVQDTIQARWWACKLPLVQVAGGTSNNLQGYSTSTWYGMRNVTTLVTSVTQFVDTAVTNYYNTSTLANTTYVKSWDIGAPQIPATNLAHERQTSTVLELNGTATVTEGVTVTSPQAFYVFSTVKVITVPAVTDNSGNAACTTTSTDPAVCTYLSYNYTTHLSDNIFPGVNTYAEGYFESEPTMFSTAAPVSSAYDHNITPTYNKTVIATLEAQIVSFSTPFIYQPLRGAVQREANDAQHFIGDNIYGGHLRRRAVTPATTLTAYDGALEDFGYVPQALIDWMAQNPDYAAQYPGLESCLPGGPSILPRDQCELQPAPATAEPVPDLTLNQAFTVQGEGCFHPGACPTSQPTGQVSVIQAAPAAAAAGTQAQPTQIPAPSSKVPAGIPLLPQLLHPSGKDDIGSGTQSSGTQQERPKKQSSANSPPKDQAAEHSTPETTTQPIPIIPSVIEEAISTSGNQPQPRPQPQPQPQSNEQSANDKAASINQNSNPESNGSPSPSPNQNQPPRKNTAPVPMKPEAVQPNIASAVMAGFGPAPTSPAPSPPIPLVEGGSTLTPGAAPVTISGTTYSVAPSGTAVVVNGATSPFRATVGNESPPPFIAGGVTFTPGSPGAPGVTISGTTYSIPTSGSPTVVFVNGSPSPLSVQGGTSKPAPFVAGGETVTVSGTTFSVASGGGAVVVKGETSSLPVVADTTHLPLVVGSGTTATPAGAAGTAQPELVIGSQTLTPGQAVTMSGTVVSLPSAAETGAGNGVVVGGSTETFAAPTGGAGAVGISIGSEVVTASFVPQTAGANGRNSTGSVGTGTGSTSVGGNVTGQGFRSDAWRTWDWDGRWTGWTVGVVLFGMVVV